MSSVSCAPVLALAFVAVLLGPAGCADKVQLNFYSESLCPDCIAYANGPLDNAIKEVGAIFTLNYVPWGNARLDGKTIVCQHGELECALNTIEACALHYYPNETDFWPYLHCIDIDSDPNLNTAEKCAGQLRYNWTAISQCANGDLGYKLDIMYYEETAALKPPHEYTPWVTINGKHEPKAEGSGVIQAICKAYTGTDKPNACDSTFYYD